MARSQALDRLNYRDNVCPLDSRVDVEKLLSLPYSRISLITAVLELRPALLSAYVYGTPDYWWVLLDYNQLTYSQFTVGTVIRLPDIGPMREWVRTSNSRLLTTQVGNANERFRLPRRTLIV